MAIPDFQTLMLPVLDASKTGEAKIGDAVERRAGKFASSDQERASWLPSELAFPSKSNWE